ncbi:unnamed protein product, partial [Rotaria sp. Silwood2]
MQHVEKIGDLLHTLQDFYSHSNWVEMGKTEINPHIGIQENIGRIAEITQATCSSVGCKKIQSKCNLIQKFIIKTCPMEYYECKDNILDEINKQAFIPHPAIRFGGQAGNSEYYYFTIIQLGFIRSLAQFFIDAKTRDGSGINTEDFKKEHTIDELYQLAHPDWTEDKVKLYSYPLKSIIDKIQVRDALVDLNPSTKDLPSAHFDSESFNESNHRIMRLRKKVIEDASDPNKDLDAARGKSGDLRHTRQDFYSHSNWVEMGKPEINRHIGIQENIG